MFIPFWLLAIIAVIVISEFYHSWKRLNALERATYELTAKGYEIDELKEYNDLQRKELSVAAKVDRRIEDLEFELFDYTQGMSGEKCQAFRDKLKEVSNYSREASRYGKYEEPAPWE